MTGQSKSSARRFSTTISPVAGTGGASGQSTGAKGGGGGSGNPAGSDGKDGASGAVGKNGVNGVASTDQLNNGTIVGALTDNGAYVSIANAIPNRLGSRTPAQALLRRSHGTRRRGRRAPRQERSSGRSCPNRAAGFERLHHLDGRRHAGSLHQRDQRNADLQHHKPDIRKHKGRYQLPNRTSPAPRAS